MFESKRLPISPLLKNFTRERQRKNDTAGGTAAHGCVASSMAGELPARPAVKSSSP